MKEFPIIQKSWKKGMKRACIVFPNRYTGGVYCLGPLIVYNLINSRDDWICDRKFLGDEINGYDLVGFTWQYELDIFNIKDMIGVKGRKFCGGPCVTTNIDSLKNDFDFFILGECEEVLNDVLDCYENDKELSKIKGVFVPGLNKKRTYASCEKFWEYYPIVQPLPKAIDRNYVFGDIFMLEIERSCPFNCKYCSISNQYQNLRYIPFDEIKKIIDKGIEINKRRKIMIYCPAFTHPKRKEILQHIIDKGLEFSVPSIRVEYADDELLKLILKGGQRTLTIAPECGESLRPSVGKDIKDSVFFDLASRAFGFRKIKLYMMVGLPNQENEDLDEIVEFVKKFDEIFKGQTYVSINTFVPKPGTTFANYEFNKKKAKQQIKYLRRKLKVKVKFSNVSTSFKEWLIAKGVQEVF